MQTLQCFWLLQEIKNNTVFNNNPGRMCNNFRVLHFAPGRLHAISDVGDYTLLAVRLAVAAVGSHPCVCHLKMQGLLSCGH